MGIRLVLKNVRFAFVAVFEPVKSDMDAEPKFSVRALLDKKDPQIAKIKAAIKQAVEDKWPDPKSRPKGLRTPLRDADAEAEAEGREVGENYKGHYFLNANVLPKFGRPEVVDASLQQADSDKWGAGDYGNVSIDIHGYNKGGNGVRAGLGNVQFTRKGEPMGGVVKVSASSEFEEEETSAEWEDKEDIY